MKQSVALAMFALIVCSSSSSVRAEQGNSAGPLRLNVPMVQAPAPMNRPKQESQIPKQIRSIPAPEMLAELRIRRKSGREPTEMCKAALSNRDARGPFIGKSLAASPSLVESSSSRRSRTMERRSS
jgi:hypothetical protein